MLQLLPHLCMLVSCPPVAWRRQRVVTIEVCMWETYQQTGTMPRSHSCTNHCKPRIHGWCIGLLEMRPYWEVAVDSDFACLAVIHIPLYVSLCSVLQVSELFSAYGTVESSLIMSEGTAASSSGGSGSGDVSTSAANRVDKMVGKQHLVWGNSVRLWRKGSRRHGFVNFTDAAAALKASEELHAKDMRTARTDQIIWAWLAILASTCKTMTRKKKEVWGTILGWLEQFCAFSYASQLPDNFSQQLRQLRAT